MDLAEALVRQHHNFSSAQHGFLLPPHRHWPLHVSCILNTATEAAFRRSPPGWPFFSLYRAGNSGSVRRSHLLTKGYKTSRVVASGFEPTNFDSGAQALWPLPQNCFTEPGWSWRPCSRVEAWLPVSLQLTGSWDITFAPRVKKC